MARWVLAPLLVVSIVALAVLAYIGGRSNRSSVKGDAAPTSRRPGEPDADILESPGSMTVQPPRHNAPLDAGSDSTAMTSPVLRPKPTNETKGAELEVLLVAAETGEPLEDVAVELEQWWMVVRGKLVAIGETDAVEKPDDARWSYSSETESDGEGRCVFRGLEPGDYQLLVGRNDDVDAESVHLCILQLEADEHRTVTAALRTTGDVPYDAVIVDSLRHEPIPDAWADFFDPDSGPYDGYALHVVADDEGHLFARVPSWRHVRARVGGEAHATIVVRLAEKPTSPESPERIALDPLAELEVSVLDERGRGARGISVRLETRQTGADRSPFLTPTETPAESWTGETDSDGLARFTGLPPGQELFASLARDRVYDRRIARAILLAPGDHARTTLHLIETSLTGVALDRRGAPLPSLPIWLVRADSLVEPSATHRLTDADRARAHRTSTDASGRFSFSDVLPGAWWVGPEPPGDPPSHAFAPNAVAVVIAPEDVSRELVLTVEAER